MRGGYQLLSCQVFFNLVLFFLLTLRRGGGEVEDAPRPEHRVLSTLLFAIWIAGAGVLTFISPYTVVGNAYIACWLGFIASGYLFFVALHTHTQFNVLNYDTPRMVFFLLLLASVVELTQASLDCPPNGGCSGAETAWSLSVGLISTVIAFVCICIAMIRKYLPNILFKIVATLLFAMWICGAGVLTYGGGPFDYVGNAYFACWGAYLTSGYLFFFLPGFRNGKR